MVQPQDGHERRVVRHESLGNVCPSTGLHVHNFTNANRLNARNGCPTNIAVTLSRQLSAFPEPPAYEPSWPGLANQAEHFIHASKCNLWHRHLAMLKWALGLIRLDTVLVAPVITVFVQAIPYCALALRHIDAC